MWWIATIGYSLGKRGLQTKGEVEIGVDVFFRV